MEVNKTAIPENVSPRKKKKLEKIEANLAKKRQKESKTIILDNFGKKIMRTVVVIAFIAILAPFLFVTLSQKTSYEDVTVESAVTYVEKAFENKVKAISYEYEVSGNTITEKFAFSGTDLTQRETYAGTSKVVMRKPTIEDKTYIQEKYADKTDADIAEYVRTNTTDYLIITYNLNNEGNYIEVDASLSSTNSTTFGAKGKTYEEIITKLVGQTAFDATNVTSANAKQSYNLFGLGYSYADYKLFLNDSYVTFEGDSVVEVYDFASTTTYKVSVSL